MANTRRRRRRRRRRSGAGRRAAVIACCAAVLAGAGFLLIRDRQEGEVILSESGSFPSKEVPHCIDAPFPTVGNRGGTELKLS